MKGLIALFGLVLLASAVYGFAGTPINATQSLDSARQLISQLDFVTEILVFLLVLGIAVISFLAYRKKQSVKLLIVSLAFWLFTVKWALKVLDFDISSGYFTDPIENVLELGIIALLYVALLKK